MTKRPPLRPELIRIVVEPVINDGPLYYKTIVYDLEIDVKSDLRSTVRDIFHTDSAQIAIEILHKVFSEGRV